MTNARTLTRALAGRWHGWGGTARCPAHDDSNPSLSIRDGDTGPLLKCHAGCESRDVFQALRDRGLIGDDNYNPVGRKVQCPPARPVAPEPNGHTEVARSIWRNADPAPGTKVETYLRTRGIKLTPPPSLRFARSLTYPQSGITLPAMIAAYQAPDRTLLGVHRTFLKPDASDKAMVAQPRLSLGPQTQAAIRLAHAGEVLGLAEGVEDALSAMQLFSVPCWSAISAGRLGSVGLPAVVRHVYIFADNGDRGVKEAHAAADVYTRQRRKVSVQFPPSEFKDWNAYLTAQVGPEVTA